MKNKPLITVITISYNAETTIEKTVRSVVSQKNEFIEYIIVDAQSNDKTLEILNRYNVDIDILISEPDKGLYDAMNKGIACANGLYVNFLNSGDLYTDEALSVVLKAIKEKSPKIIYSDFILFDEDKERIITDSKLNKNLLRKSFSVCHQTIFAATEIINNYDLRYKIKADYKWVYESINKIEEKDIYKIDEPIIKYLRGGFSHKYFWLNLRELIKLHYELFGFLQVLYNVPAYTYSILRNYKQRTLGW
jgi:glycosyltransferase involved in cell wall biosynthesis